jgi:hypothetical protein
MIYLRTDNKGNILLISAIANTQCLAYAGEVPADFSQTAGLGKYQLINGVITPVPGWVQPILKPLL